MLDEEDEALGDLVRAPEGAKRDPRRAREELTSFPLRYGVLAPKGTTGAPRGSCAGSIR